MTSAAMHCTNSVMKALLFSDAYWPGAHALEERQATRLSSCTQVTASIHLSTTSTIVKRHRCRQVLSCKDDCCTHRCIRLVSRCYKVPPRYRDETCVQIWRRDVRSIVMIGVEAVPCLMQGTACRNLAKPLPAPVAKASSTPFDRAEQVQRFRHVNGHGDFACAHGSDRRSLCKQRQTRLFASFTSSGGNGVKYQHKLLLRLNVSGSERCYRR